MSITFTKKDLATPGQLERLLQRFNLAIDAASKGPALPTIDELVARLAPGIRDQLQATGIAPLNLQSLLPSIGTAVLIEDTHANRLTLYPPSNYPVGTAFFETDRLVVYAVFNNAGTLVWKYVSGLYSAAFASRPTDLAANDVGFLLFVTLYRHTCRWSGSAWVILDNDAGSFIDSSAALTDGYALCDGAGTTYLTISGADLAETAITTPDLITGAPTFNGSIAGYTGVVNAAAAPGISGSTANTTATNVSATATNQATVVTAHTVVERLDVPGAGIFVFDDAAAADHASHNHTQDAHNHTQNAHLHAVGTLAVDATGTPRYLGVLKYFRR